jgi:hypothetical protein
MLNQVAELPNPRSLEREFTELSGHFNQLPRPATYLETSLGWGMVLPTQYQESRLGLLSELLVQFGFGKEHIAKVVIDPKLPLTVGGYFHYSDDAAEQFIAINPTIFLFAKPDYLAHVIRHEQYHAAFGVNGATAEVNVWDEALVDLMTILSLQEQGLDPMQSGYWQIVQELRPYLQSLTSEELSLAYSSDPQQTFLNLIQLMFIRPYLMSGDLRALSSTHIEQVIKAHWPLMQKLFPRLLNEIAFANLSAEQSTDATLADVWPADNKFKLWQQQLLWESGGVSDLLEQLLPQYWQTQPRPDIYSWLAAQGYDFIGYLPEFDNREIAIAIDEILQTVLLRTQPQLELEPEI